MSIPKKNKKCIFCGREDQPWFSRKRCRSCAQKSYGKPKQISDKQEVKKKQKSQERDAYFKYHIDRCTHSEETGKPIYNPTRANCSHILDKGRHESMQSNLGNCIHLSVQEHATLDNHLFKHEFEKLEELLPNAWKIYCERARKLIPLCQENTRFIRKLSEYLELSPL